MSVDHRRVDHMRAVVNAVSTFFFKLYLFTFFCEAPKKKIK